MNTPTLTPKAIFKNNDAYTDSNTLVCYIDSKGNSYTRNDFMNLAGNNIHLSQFLFESVVTQSPKDLVEQWRLKSELPY